MSTHAAVTRPTSTVALVGTLVHATLGGLICLLGLASRPASGRHARPGARAALWPELALHYVVAAFTWTRTQGVDESALERSVRWCGVVALVSLVTLVAVLVG